MSSNADVMEEYDDDVQESGLTEAKGRPTPGRRQKKKNDATKQQGNMITRPIYGFLDYLSDVREEIAKVTWPTRDEVVRMARIVIAVTIASAIVLGIVSITLTQIFSFGLSNDNHWVYLVMVAIMVIIGFFLIRGDNSTSKYKHSK